MKIRDLFIDEAHSARTRVCVHGSLHARTKTTSAKLYIHIGVGSGDLFIDEAHMAYSRYFFPSCCLLPFAAFLILEHKIAAAQPKMGVIGSHGGLLF